MTGSQEPIGRIRGDGPSWVTRAVPGHSGLACDPKATALMDSPVEESPRSMSRAILTGTERAAEKWSSALVP